MTDRKYQQTNFRVSKTIWNTFKGNTAYAGRTAQSVLEELIQSANCLDWTTISPKAKLKVITENDNSEGTEGLGNK